jgi:predicted Zn-dependent peptidase
MSVLGSSETITNIKRDTILDYMSRCYSPERIIIAAVGNVKHDEIVDAFEKLFIGLKPVEEKEKKYTHDIDRNIRCYYKELEQTNICIGGAAPSLSSEKRYAGAILNTILGGNMSSRLFQEVREKRGLAYSIYSYFSAYMDAGILGICAGTDSREVNNVLEVISNEIVKIQEGHLSEEDLQTSRDHIIGNIMLGSENTDSRMMRLAKNEFVFGRHVEYEELIENLEQVTLDDVIDSIKEAFSESNVAITTLGKLKREDLRFSPGSVFS